MRKFSLLKSRTAAVVTGSLVVVGLGATGATAANLIDSGDIRNGSIRGVDIANHSIDRSEIRDGSLGFVDLGKGVQNRLRQANGDEIRALDDEINGNNGLRSEVGQLKTDVEALKGAPGYVGEHWSIVDRNVIGAGDAFLRSGPTAASAEGVLEPPHGLGSLGIRTASGADKAAFGNQVEFVGQTVDSIEALGYSVFTTGENNAKAPNNMPSITFEIDPNIEGSTRGYSSMVFVPENSDANTWTDIDAIEETHGKVWGLTGADMPCNINGARCTWTELMAELAPEGDTEPATILTVQITKGRDFAFSGAVDGLRLNDKVFDFEPNGVVVTSSTN
jgi:hypothetical protein